MNENRLSRPHRQTFLSQYRNGFVFTNLVFIVLILCISQILGAGEVLNVLLNEDGRY